MRLFFAPLAAARAAAHAAAARIPTLSIPFSKLAGAATTALAAAYFYTHESEDSVVANMCRVFEHGGAPAWDADFEFADRHGGVPRLALHGQILALLSPRVTPDAKRYAAVVGASGTGKSTAVRKAVRASGSGRVKGAVYFMAPTGITSFSTDLMRALDYREPFSLLSPFRSLVSKDAKEPASQIALLQPVASWRSLAPILRKAARRFTSLHGRPAVLVLDAMDLVAKKDPAFFSEVQDFAKQCADDGTLRIVLVFSDGRALPLLQSNSALSRSIKPFEVGDISDEEAESYLLGLGVSGERAKALVKEVAGGRFPLLQEHALTGEAVEDIVRQLHIKTETDLIGVAVSPSCALFRALLAQKSVTTAAALRLLGKGQVSALLELNILAAHPDGTFTFHSRHVASYVAREVEKAARAEAARSSRWWF